MPVKSYGFAIGNLRARENTLLKSSDLMQLMSAKNTNELAILFRDKGIGYSTSPLDIPKMLSDDNEKLWKYLTEIAPDMAVFDPFIYENDFHNLKAILKSVIRIRDYDDLVIVPANVDVALIEKAIKEKRFDILPDYMRTAAERSYEIMVESSDSQLADGVIDAYCMKSQLDKAISTKNKIVIEVITITVVYNNIKVALRAAKTNKSKSFLEEAIIDTNVISKNVLISASLKGTDGVLDLLSSLSIIGGPSAAECYKKSAGEFEKFVDDRIISVAKQCKYVTLGIEPLIGYMLARKAEIKDLRIISNGIKTNQPEEKIEERLRELYG